MNTSDDSFLKANANADYIASKLADMIRNAMRAMVSNDHYASQVYEGSQNLKYLLELISYAETKELHAYDVFEKAVKNLQPESSQNEDYVDRCMSSAAESVMRLMIERSCYDNAAKARISKREMDFLNDIKHLEEAREERKRKR